MKKNTKNIQIKTAFCIITALFFFGITRTVDAQIELIPIQHPVYEFLTYAETKGFFKHFSMSAIPFQKNEIISLLKILKDNEEKLSSVEKSTLSTFAKEFGIEQTENAVLFYSSSDSTQLISNRFFSNDEKYIYHYSDSLNSV